MADLNCPVPELPSQADVKRKYAEMRKEMPGLPGVAQYRREAARRMGLDYKTYMNIWEGRTVSPSALSGVRSLTNKVVKAPAPDNTVAIGDLAKKAVTKLSADDLITLDEYVTSGAYGPLNAGLRGHSLDESLMMFYGGASDVNDINMGWVNYYAKQMDSVLAKSRTVDELTLYRGVNHDLGKLLRIGSSIEDKGFVSSSADRAVAESFGNTMLRIKYPKGRSAIYVDAIPDITLGQKEVLLPRNLKMRVTNITKIKDRMIIDVQVE